MILTSDFKVVCLSNLVRKKAPIVAEALEEILKKEEIPVRFLNNTNDIWCKDYMPIWINKKECVQFVFDPAYYKYAGYLSWRTEPLMVTPQLNLQPYYCWIVLDGGNLISYGKTGITTERIFSDNPKKKDDQLLDELSQQLTLNKLVVIPELPKDCTGHIDGMVRFVDEQTVVLTELSKIVPSKLARQIKLSLLNAGLKVISIPNNLHLNNSYDDNTGDYVNYFEMGKFLVIPCYDNELDYEIRDIYSHLFPTKRIYQINASTLTPLGGGLNCMTWCMPR